MTTNKEQRGVDFSGKSLILNTAEDATHIIAAISSCPVLHCLTLTGNTLGVAAAEAIAKSLECHPGLKAARWSDMFTGRRKTEILPALKALGDGMIVAGARLKMLDLSDNTLGPIGVDGLTKLLQSEVCSELEELHVNNNGLGATGARLLAKTLSSKPLKLRVFEAGRNSLEDDGVTALAQVLEVQNGLPGGNIAMPENGIYHVGISALSEAFKRNPQLSCINLNDNPIGPMGAAAVAQALPSLKNLKRIYLRDCLLKSEGARTLTKAFKDNSTLVDCLDLSHNEIGRVACKELVDAITQLPGSINRLSRVVLAGNSLDTESGDAEEVSDVKSTEGNPGDNRTEDAQHSFNENASSNNVALVTSDTQLEEQSIAESQDDENDTKDAQNSFNINAPSNNVNFKVSISIAHHNTLDVIGVEEVNNDGNGAHIEVTPCPIQPPQPTHDQSPPQAPPQVQPPPQSQEPPPAPPQVQPPPQPQELPQTCPQPQEPPQAPSQVQPPPQPQELPQTCPQPQELPQTCPQPQEPPQAPSQVQPPPQPQELPQTCPQPQEPPQVPPQVQPPPQPQELPQTCPQPQEPPQVPQQVQPPPQPQELPQTCPQPQEPPQVPQQVQPPPQPQELPQTCPQPQEPPQVPPQVQPPPQPQELPQPSPQPQEPPQTPSQVQPQPQPQASPAPPCLLPCLPPPPCLLPCLPPPPCLLPCLPPPPCLLPFLPPPPCPLLPPPPPPCPLLPPPPPCPLQ